MLEKLNEVMTSIHNFFEIDGASRCSRWTIENGSIELPFLSEGQYFMVRDSVFNDGVHAYPATDLVDETFVGDIIPLAVPSAFIRVVEKIAEWDAKNAATVNSPYESESFNGYSYKRMSGCSCGIDAFSKELRPWRKIS